MGRNPAHGRYGIGGEMSRKAGQRSAETRASLLEAATVEFARSGFQKASLRTICADAGVTTGALYFFFKNKEDLFQAVVAPVERLLEELVELFSNEDLFQERPSDQSIDEGTRACLSELYDSKEALATLLNNRDLEVVGEFFDRVIGKAEKRIENALACSDEAVADDPFLAHWYAHLQVEMVLHAIQHSASVEEAEGHMKKMMKFARGGLRAIAES